MGNPAVEKALSEIGDPDVAGIVGTPPAMGGMNGGNGFGLHAEPPQPPPETFKEKPLSPTQQKAVLAEAASLRGFSTLAAKKFQQLGALMPGAERFRVRKRRADGSMATIGDYNYRDIEQSLDIEAFISSYLKPQYGGGDYEMALIDSTGKEFHAGVARFMGAPLDPDAPSRAPVDPTAGFMPLMVEMYRKSTQPQPDPFQQLLQMRKVLDMDAPKGDNGNTILAMMQMQQSQAAENMKMMMALMAPRQDDAMKSLLERMDRRLEKLETAPPPPPPMPVMPQNGASTAELITAIGTLATGLIPIIKGDGVKATDLAALILQAQQAAKPQDALGVKDVIAIFQDKEARQSAPATLEEQIGTLVRVKELAAAISPTPQGPQGTTFWDALVTLFGNGDFAKAIGNKVDRGLEPKQVEIVHNRPAQQAQEQRQQLPAEQQQAAPQKPQEDPVPLPADFGEKCKAIENSKTPGDRITATVDALWSLRNVGLWQDFLKALVEAIARGDVDTSLRGLGGWLKKLVDNNMLSKKTALETIGVFKEHFATVREGLLERMPALRALAQQAPVEPAPAAPQAPVETAPAADAPKPSGPPPAAVDIGDNDAAAYSQESL